MIVSSLIILKRVEKSEKTINEGNTKKCKSKGQVKKKTSKKD